MYDGGMTTTPTEMHLDDWLTLADGRSATVFHVEPFYRDEALVDTDDDRDRFWTSAHALGARRIVRNRSAEQRVRMARWTRTGSATR
jgi:hypothetical protein